MKKSIMNILGQHEQNMLKELAEYRHKIHVGNFNVSRKVFEFNLNKANDIINRLNLPSIPKCDLSKSIEEVLFHFDTKNYELFEDEKKVINSLIEDYLYSVDEIFDTKYCPSGSLRSLIVENSNVSNVKRGQVYWVERKANGLFSCDNDKHKYIPALVVSPDSWNKTHDNYGFVSITREEYIRNQEYNVSFMLNDTEHIIRCFNSFSARKIHIKDYITTLDEDIMCSVVDKIALFNGIDRDVNEREEELSELIERVIRVKAEKVKMEMIRESRDKGLDIIIQRLSDLFPDSEKDHIEAQEQKEEVITNIVDEAATTDSFLSISKYNKWDEKTARKFLDDYNNTINKKELANKYNYKSVGSLYTRKQRCMEILGLAQ